MIGAVIRIAAHGKRAEPPSHRKRIKTPYSQKVAFHCEHEKVRVRAENGKSAVSRFILVLNK